MDIVFIRHGESTANRMGIIQGQGDFPLSETGREQARLTEKALVDFRPQRVYTSPLRRGRETAEIINGPHGAPLMALAELMEYDLGEFEGFTMDEITARFPQVRERTARGVPFHHLPADAETDEQVDKRTRRALSMIMQCGCNRVVVVSHLGVLAFMIAVLLERLSLDNPCGKKLVLKNCSISRICTKPVPKVIAVNDDSHLCSFAGEAGFR